MMDVTGATRWSMLGELYSYSYSWSQGWLPGSPVSRPCAMWAPPGCLPGCLRVRAAACAPGPPLPGWLRVRAATCAPGPPLPVCHVGYIWLLARLVACACSSVCAWSATARAAAACTQASAAVRAVVPCTPTQAGRSMSVKRQQTACTLSSPLCPPPLPPLTSSAFMR